MKSPFILVHEKTAATPKRPSDQLRATLEHIRSAEPAIANTLMNQAHGLTKALIATSFGESGDVHSEFQIALPTLKRVAKEFDRQPTVITVGIWDLGSKVGYLSRLIDMLNAVQSALVIFQVEAAIPAGMMSQPEKVIEWAKTKTGKYPSAKDRKDIVVNMIAEDFYLRAEGVRKDLGLDYLVGLTPSMIAWEDEDSGNVHWNYFSVSDRRLILASTYDLRRYAAQAQRPFEVAIGGLITAQLLEALNPKVTFHPETRGCLFDFNEDRDTIIESIRAARIEDQCLQKIQSKYKKVALDILDSLRTYTRGTPE